MQLENELTNKLPQALSGFDEMPASSYVRLPIVKALYGISSASVWRHSATGLMPGPIKLSKRCTAWNVGLIKADLAAKGMKNESES